ncbi:MAG: molybdate transport system ATP-binding protein [Candidatus Azotimanducaceae bacterium]|jgi:molybdate transport system ATP-binding protein
MAVQRISQDMSLELIASFARDDFDIAINTSIPTDRVSALFGPSGAGKSTILRLIAGLDRYEGATVRFNSQTWQDEQTFVPPHHRQIGYVFQHLNLFPHLTASANLLYAEKRSHKPGGLGRKSVIEMLDLGTLLGRYPHQLSGGEKQRVAIARAILSNPDILLMDEPLGSIDTKARNRILPYLQNLHLNSDIPVIYVSHSVDEVLYLCDLVYSINRGKIVSERNVLDFSAQNDADTEESSAIIRCTVMEMDISGSSVPGSNGLASAENYSLTPLSFEGQFLLIAADHFRTGDHIRVKIPARDVSLIRTPIESSIVNVLPTVITDISDPGFGPSALIKLQCGEQQLLARITRKSLHDLKFEVNEKVFAQIKGVALMSDHER